MDPFQLGRCLFVGLTMEDFKSIGKVESFEEEKDSVRAGLIEPGRGRELEGGEGGTPEWKREE